MTKYITNWLRRENSKGWDTEPDRLVLSSLSSAVQHSNTTSSFWVVGWFIWKGLWLIWNIVKSLKLSTLRKKTHLIHFLLLYIWPMEDTVHNYYFMQLPPTNLVKHCTLSTSQLCPGFTLYKIYQKVSEIGYIYIKKFHH